MNAGERDEYLVAIRLVQMRDAGLSLPTIGNITSVGFVGQDYNPSPFPYGSGEISNTTSTEVMLDTARKIGISKAGRDYKADIIINGIGISIKSQSAAPPAIVNHTARHGWERVCDCAGADVNTLDSIIREYWEKRIAGEIREDIGNDNSSSPFARHQKFLSPILGYFLFKGTGARDSKLPADLILEVANPLDESTWRLLYPTTVVNELWNQLVFSMRSKKGMPSNYPHMKDQEKLKSIAIWTKNWQGEYRGALHVRAR